jgi:16S rRNA G966 N2-methylase RsmD
VWALDLPRGFGRLAEVLARADLVLADPPYGGAEARAVLESLGHEGVLGPGARLVIEHHAKDEVPERSGPLVRTRARRYGETMVSSYAAVRSAAEERER